MREPSAATVASIERMKQIAANLKAPVVIQHDMRDIGKLPAVPATVLSQNMNSIGRFHDSKRALVANRRLRAT